MKRRHIVVLFALFIVSLFSAYLWRTQKRPPPPQPIGGARSAVPIPPPSFPPVPTIEQPAYVVPTEAAFPGSLPAYVRTSSFSDNTPPSSVAARLGFSGTPKTLATSRGSVYLWTNGAASFTIGGNPADFDYQSGENAGRQITTITPEGARAMLEAFLKKAGLTGPETGFSLTAIHYFDPKSPGGANEIFDASRATLALFVFDYTLGGRPLYGGIPGTGGISIRINGTGSVVSVSGYWYPGLKKEGSFPIISSAAAVARLIAHSGVLLDVSSTNKTNEEPETFSLATTTITKTELGYYASQGESRLSPIFVFFGKSNNDNTGNPVTTVSVVSAVATLSATPAQR
ncbi:hypothetical protein M1555_04255 [Patescibacteria group bacterium]|nr:hypothetical protein [Patescibacteria group bacterium]